MNNRKVNAYLANGGGPGVLVLHAWWGLKPFFKQLCDRLAEQGFTALAPDLRNGQIAKTIEEAKTLMEKSDGDLTGGAVMTAKDYLLDLMKNKIGVIGFSMGAVWALIASSYKPEQFTAVVLFYGNEGVYYGKITAKVMGHYSDNDEWEPKEFVDNTFAEFKKALAWTRRFTSTPGLPIGSWRRSPPRNRRSPWIVTNSSSRHHVSPRRSCRRLSFRAYSTPNFRRHWRMVS